GRGSFNVVRVDGAFEDVVNVFVTWFTGRTTSKFCE
ncbi:hypothetical protein SOVF_214640, partial [Spinacia oleracea]